jgi:ketosteroid isomerase-like protein
VNAAAVAAQVKAAIKTQVDAYAARDVAKAATILADDVVGHSTPRRTSSVRQRSWRDATYTFTFTNPATKKAGSETGTWVAVFKRQADGTMKLSRDMVLDMPAK